MESLSIWTEAFEAQCRQRDINANVVKHQQICLAEVIDRMAKSENELDRSRFALKRAKDDYSRYFKEMGDVSSPLPSFMQKRLEECAEKVNECTRAVQVGEGRLADRQKEVGKAKDDLAFDQDRQEKILTELTTITKRIQELSSDTPES